MSPIYSFVQSFDISNPLITDLYTNLSISFFSTPFFQLLFCIVNFYCVCIFIGLSDALIEALSDRDASVRKTAASSLIEIGRHQLEISLKAGLDFLTKHPRVGVLNTCLHGQISICWCT